MSKNYRTQRLGSFVLQLKNRFQALEDMMDHTDPRPDDINTMWEQTKAAYVKSNESCLGYKHNKKKEWISEDAWNFIECRRALMLKKTGK